MIYLEPKAQQRIASTFAFVANPGALLFLGASEPLSPFSEFFKQLDNKWRIAERMKYPVPALATTPPLSRAQVRTVAMGPRNASAGPTSTDWRGIVPEVEKFLIDRLAPPTVIINGSGDVVHIHGDTGKYLRPAAGHAGMNIYSMARKGLKSDLTSAILSSRKSGDEVHIKGIKLEVYGQSESVDVTVLPILDSKEMEGFTAVVFEESRPQKSKKKGTKLQLPGNEYDMLREKLEDTQKRLNATTVDLEASHEEARSLSEELESTNEEFQSTNEELETSREELQSVNEELLTVNNELQQRIDTLARVNSDMSNLLNNTEIATIFVDTKLMLRQFTEPATKLLDLVPSDIGRSLAAFSTRLLGVDLAALAKGVVDTLKMEEREVQSKDGTWYFMRLLPYRTEDNAPDGSVITFVDITSRKLAERETSERAEDAKRKAQRLEAMMKSMGEGLIETDLEGGVIYANPAALRMFNARSIKDFGPSFDSFRKNFEIRSPEGMELPSAEWPLEMAINGKTFFDKDFQITRRGTGHQFVGSFNGTPVVDQDGKVKTAIITIRESKSVKS